MIGAGPDEAGVQRKSKGPWIVVERARLRIPWCLNESIGRAITNSDQNKSHFQAVTIIQFTENSNFMSRANC